MSLTAIQARIEEVIKNGVLTLRAAANPLGSKPVAALLERYFGGTLSGRAKKLGDGYTLVQGEAVHCLITLESARFRLYPQDTPLEVSLTFTAAGDDAGAIALAVAITLPAGYRFADSFAVLRDQPAHPINQLTLEGPTLSLHSSEVDTIECKVGLGLEGPLGPVSGLASAALPAGARTLHGTIGIVTAGDTLLPTFALEALRSFRCDLGTGYALDVRLRLRSAVEKATSAWHGQIELATDLVTPALTLPMVLPLLGAAPGLLSFHLDRGAPDLPALSALEQLAGFTGGRDPAGQLGLLPGLDQATLALDHVTAVVDPVARQVVSVQIQVRLGLGWTILPGVLELEDVGALLSVPYPGVTAAAQPRASLFGRLKLGTKTHLEADIQLPEGVLHARLADGGTVGAGTAMSTFAKGLALPGAAAGEVGQGARDAPLTIERLDVFADVGSGDPSYALEAQTAGRLDVVAGVTLEDIALSIAYQRGAFAKAQLSGRMAWGPVRFFMSMTAVQ